MRKQILFGSMVVVGLALLLSLNSIMASAQGPVGPANQSPYNAFALLDNTSRPIPPTTTLWYYFGYGGDKTPVFINMPNGWASGLEFRVYTVDQASRLDIEDKPVGRGMSNWVPCDTGKCQSPDLTWQGGFSVGGTYFVAVVNPTTKPLTFMFSIKGDNVFLSPADDITPVPTVVVTTSVTPAASPVVVASPTVSAPVIPPVVVPAGTPSGPVNVVVGTIPVPTIAAPVPNDSPYTAIFVPDNREQKLPANTSAWYKFGYGGDKSKVLISLQFARVSGLEFRVYTPDQALRFDTEDKPIGMGMPPTIVCDAGKCTADDKVWIGSFNAPGMYFIKVTNPNEKPFNFKMHIEGDNINIIE